MRRDVADADFGNGVTFATHDFGDGVTFATA